MHSVAARGDGFPCEGQTVSGGDGNLEFYEVETGNLLRDRMLDLQTRVHFQKVKVETGINKEFNRTGIDIAASARQADSGIAHLSAQFGSDNGGRRFLDHLLMAALHGTFTFPKRDDAAVGVGEDLDFHVMRTVETFFEIEAIVAETIHSLGRSIAECGFEFGFAVHQAHTFAAATGDGLQENGIAHSVREGLRCSRILNWVVCSWDRGNVGAAGKLAAGGFGAKRFHSLGWRPNKNEASVNAGAGQCGVFRKEPVARMHGIAADATRHVH